MRSDVHRRWCRGGRNIGTDGQVAVTDEPDDGRIMSDIKPGLAPRSGTLYPLIREYVNGRVARREIIPRTGYRWKLVLNTFAENFGNRQLAAKSVRNVHAVLSKALADALRLRMVSRNVAARALLPTVPARKPRAWSADELRLFLARIADDRWSAIWRLLATTGMRRGEVLGVRWQDLDLAAGTLTITQQRAIAGGSVVQGPPKTAAGARTVALDAVTLMALRSLRKVQAAERLAMGEGWIDTGGLVFTWPDGSPPWPQAITAWFKLHAEALGLPTIGVHGLRHTAATWLIASGVSPKVVAQRLGHSHVSVTLQLYSDVLPAHDRATADALAAALDA